MPDQNPTTLGAGMSDEEQYRLSDKTQLKQVKDSMNQTTARPLHNYEVLGQQMITYLCLTYGREPTQVEFEKIWNAFDDAAEEIYE